LGYEAEHTHKIVVDFVSEYDKVSSMANKQYKTLTAGDTIRKGDEWAGSDGIYEECLSMIGVVLDDSQACRYRRPIKSKAKRVKTLNVGKGYRVVKPDEIVKKGDEFNYKVAPSASEAFWMGCSSQIGKEASTYSERFVVRRKVEVKTPEVKQKPAKNDGYYYLQEGDKIRGTNEWNIGNGRWKVQGMWDGDALWKNNVGHCRRKITQPVKEEKVANVNRPCYIFLNVGEVILEGDEYLRGKQWVKSGYTNAKTFKADVYRRQINKG
jgi:hypothetical protein